MSFDTKENVAAAHLVCAASAGSITIALQDKNGNATTQPGLTAAISAGAPCVAGLTVASTGIVIVPSGLPGLTEVVLRPPQPTGNKVILVSVLFVTDDPRPGLGAVTIA